MVQPTNRILKSDDVEIEGRLHLDSGNSVAPAQNSRNSTVGITRVRIIENKNEYAVVEVTCSCGRKTIIRCDYGDPSSAKNTQSQTEPAAESTPEKK